VLRARGRRSSREDAPASSRVRDGPRRRVEIPSPNRGGRVETIPRPSPGQTVKVGRARSSLFSDAAAAAGRPPTTARARRPSHGPMPPVAGPAAPANRSGGPAAAGRGGPRRAEGPGGRDFFSVDNGAWRAEHRGRPQDRAPHRAPGGRVPLRRRTCAPPPPGSRFAAAARPRCRPPEPVAPARPRPKACWLRWALEAPPLPPRFRAMGAGGAARPPSRTCAASHIIARADGRSSATPDSPRQPTSRTAPTSRTMDAIIARPKNTWRAGARQGRERSP